MRWKKARRSDNVVDQRGKGRRSGKGLSLAAIAAIVIMGLVSGQDPIQIISNIAGQAVQQGGINLGGQTAEQSEMLKSDPQSEFVRAILGDTEDTWRDIFSQAGNHYTDPKLVLFSGSVRSACGYADAAIGPFYCPADQQVYLDLSFFTEMEQRFAATGEFAQAYVIAHEVGHHVQTLLGVSTHVQAARQRGERVEGHNGLLVRQELQADCLAGVWAHHAQQRHNWLEPGDLKDALNAAQAIGDDRLQKQAQGYVVPDSFTHGTSQQREHWFTQGYKTGKANQCDTFSAQLL
ncbi:neutral zinc metallopeptidase [Denitrificimonas sp. JX-1]|uniref:Neutral zinc metallopeptidase n=1 Tax=Denitrificimonas halotolerans TaxID=3098930 RepID=A0ABU5GNV3_9GAMM|nr:neutral zinc metallopeptidase [Denitrificimonas sp. JX-1]MDY7218679.1 neutral zinc metallopeptidase [Denitrificimonas sp. JX-1]